MFSSHSLSLSHRHVADQLADVLHVVNVLGKEVALNLQPVGVGGEAGRCEKFNNLVFLKPNLAKLSIVVKYLANMTVREIIELFL